MMVESGSFPHALQEGAHLAHPAKARETTKPHGFTTHRLTEALTMRPDIRCKREFDKMKMAHMCRIKCQNHH